MNPARYDRQRRLPEVGAAGQERIQSSRAEIGAGPWASIELSYLVRAGVEHARIERRSPPEFAHARWFRFSGPRAVAQGSHAALCHLVSALSER